MSLDGRFLYFLAEELKEQLNQGRIQKIYQLTKTDFLFLIRAEKQNLQLVISLSTSLARIHLTEHFDEKPDNPSGFCMLLRKYLEGGVIQSVSTIRHDRIVDMVIENVSEIGDTIQIHLIQELMGRYANLIVTDEAMRIIDAYKHVSFTEDLQRTIMNGIRYEYPEDEKIDPRDMEKAHAYLESISSLDQADLLTTFRGFSPLLSKYILTLARTTSLVHAFDEAMNEVVAPTRYANKFYHFNVFGEGADAYPSLSKLLDDVFFESSKTERMKQLSKVVYQLAKRELDKNKNKLEKLVKELQTSKNSVEYKKRADLIIQNLYRLEKGEANLKALDYETQVELDIALDRLLTPVENANAYYKKYKKGKTAVGYLEEQIHKTKDWIEYFDLLLSQIENASITDIDEISDELSRLGFRKQKGKKTKTSKPHYDTYKDDEGNLIYVGKNNLQNEYLTHTLAASTDTWFHTKDIHGSHVILKAKTLTETSIRTAALLAAYFSKGRYSSSVPVDYTLVKYVKKIPGKVASFVTYSQNKTIYIDPSNEAYLRIKRVKNG